MSMDDTVMVEEFEEKASINPELESDRLPGMKGLDCRGAVLDSGSEG